MSILTEQRSNAPRGLCHCFACGKKVMIEKLLEDVGADTQLALENPCQPNRESVSLTTTQVLFKQQLPFRYSKYLEGRGIGEEVQRKFKVYEKGKKVHMPIFSKEGIYLYDNARSTDGKRFFIESGANKSLWGIEEIDLSKPVAVCESQIDAIKQIIARRIFSFHPTSFFQHWYRIHFCKYLCKKKTAIADRSS